MNAPSRDLMRAAVVTGPGATSVEQHALPQPGPGQVRVALEGCGVCASNLGPWSGPEWMSFPLAPGDLGHEGWGTVDAVGDGVDIAPGTRVAALSYKSYATHDIAEAANVVPLPPALDGQAFPGEPLGCAFNILARSDIRAGQTVAIVGIGFLGAILCRLATDAGARVIAISRRAFSLDIARQYGAAETIALTDDHPAIIERVKALTGDKLCERVIEAVGKQRPLDLAAELCAERGKLVVAGYHQDGQRTVNMWLWNWRGLDVINAHEREPAAYMEGIRAAVDAVASGRLDPAPLITHRYPLAQLDEALNATRDRPDGFLKAIVTT